NLTLPPTPEDDRDNGRVAFSPFPTRDHEANLAMTRLRVWPPLLVAAVSMMAFLPAINADFVNWDDTASFIDNPHYRGLGLQQLSWMFTTTLLAHWSPLTWITWGANYAIGGLDPRGYHLANVLLHGANVALFYLVARRMLLAGFDRGLEAMNGIGVVAGGMLAALPFALHPLRLESCPW